VLSNLNDDAITCLGYVDVSFHRSADLTSKSSRRAPRRPIERAWWMKYVSESRSRHMPEPHRMVSATGNVRRLTPRATLLIEWKRLSALRT
jgi:hypothetical protein